LNTPRAQFAATDFDGDQKLDLATDDSTRREDGGYVHRINLSLSQQPSSSFTIRTQVAARRLSALDVDGDSNRDIVLENDSREPIAVWLNDGFGNFHEGNIEIFRYRLTHADPRSLSRVPLITHFEQPGVCPQNGTVSLRVSRLAPLVMAGRLTFITEANPPSPDAYSSDSRGPPAHS
jgi:hypothetical protein